MFKKYRLCAYVFLMVIMGLMFSAVYGYADNRARLMQTEKHIDWAELYPFDGGNVGSVKPVKKSRVMDLYSRLKQRAEEITTEKLPSRFRLVEAAKRYENAIDWNFVNVSEYNGVIIRDGGYLAGYVESRDVSENAESVKGLDNFCRELGIDYMYINLPSKICISEDKDISGTLDFSNQNADNLLRMLRDSGVRAYDFRKTLHDEGMNHHESFYRTDHHWKVETGLWAARHILQILRDDYSWDVKPEILRPENFEYVIYPEWAFGSQGKKVTHIRVEPDDFTMIYPKFDARIHYEIPSLGIDVTGDFAVTYDMSQVESKDLYKYYPYTAYNHSNNPLTRFTNQHNICSKKILFLKESFSDCVVPFLALGVKNVDEIDLRVFTGSLRSCIKSAKPDIVITAYHTGVPGRRSNAGQPEDKKVYDFR